MPRNQILVIRGGAIGDFIVTLPVFAALREMFPGTRIETVAYSGVAQLALEAGLIDGFRLIESRQFAGFFAGKGDLDRDWSTYFNQFGIIISYLYDPDENLQTNIKRVSEAQFIQGPHRPDEAQAIHATDALLKPLERLAIFGADAVPKLEIKSGEVIPKACGEKWLAIHPGSGSERKNWPLASWVELVQKLLAESSWKILVIGGEADGVKLDAIQKLLPIERGMIMRGVPLASVAQALRQCDRYLGHDSGISHLAGAVGLPSVLLWGPSNQKIWGPRNDRTKVISAGANLEALPLETVWNALHKENLI
ncbi:MAG TPA: glycosyltransferase family 9 protein [Verrucomicrobiae bacterium]